LLSRQINVVVPTLASAFDNAKTYFNTIQSDLSGLGTNAVASIIYGDGLQITCAAAADLYHVRVDGADFSGVNWYSTSGCRFTARWIIDITGSGSVSFQGQPFPGIVERVIYNIVGTGRTITANNGVAGHLLAPGNSYTQSQGVTYGRVVVGNVVRARQNNKPNCVNFQAVKVSVKILKPVQLGDTTVYVTDLNNLIVGDLFCINGDCRKIVSGYYTEIDGSVVAAVNVADAYQASADGGFGEVNIVDPNNQARDTPLAVQASSVNPPDNSQGIGSSASQVVASALLATVAAVF